MVKEYTIILHSNETAGYWTEVPALPGCMSQGDTVEEAIEMTKDAIALWLESMSARSEAMPEDKDVIVRVAVPG